MSQELLTHFFQINKLQAAIKYGEDDLPGAKSLVENCPSDDPDTEVNLGCLLFKVSLNTRVEMSFSPDSIVTIKPLFSIFWSGHGKSVVCD